MARITRLKQRRSPGSRTKAFAKSDVATRSGGNLNREAAADVSSDGDIPMAESQNITATPYPFYATGGNDDDSYRAQLVSHAGASIERNQDAQFASLHRDVESSKRETVEAKFELAVQVKDAEVRAAERHGDIKAELAALRAEGLQRDVRGLERALDQKNQDETKGILAAILAKLTSA